LKLIIIIINIATIIASSFWVWTSKSLESIVTTLGLIGTLITLFYKFNDGKNIKLNQKGGKKSNNYQAAETINIEIKNDK
jgi:hypothetical protein